MKFSDLIKLSDDFWLKVPFDKGSAAMGYFRFCFVVLIEAIRVILISRQRVSNRSYSAEERIFFPGGGFNFSK